MAKNIIMQVGHLNIAYNSDVALHGSTGAPQELEKNKAITYRAAELIRLRGINVTVTDANANDDKSITDKDWDGFYAIHCDADSSTLSAGFCDYPEPSTDGATQESQRIAGVINSIFFKETGIVFRPERIQKSAGIMYYYMWKYLSAKTPCVLLEMGESMDPHDSVILKDTERCAIALARAVCGVYGVSYDITTPPPVIDWQKRYNDLFVQYTALQAQYIKDMADKNSQINSLNLKITNAKTALA